MRAPAHIHNNHPEKLGDDRNSWLHDPQLTALDPWWNPPWRATWNHSWHQAHTHHSTGMPFPNQTTKWIHTQQRTWNQLHPTNNT
ncbi:hypothetical protein AB0E62_36835 [Streptomyces sp. NPDC038707]|uniref:hypothetical protein n=1 Tax=Streptomyces sp. NPDC038707 TaxID=3154329 RepID=UPI0033D902FB